MNLLAVLYFLSIVFQFLFLNEIHIFSLKKKKTLNGFVKFKSLILCKWFKQGILILIT